MTIFKRFLWTLILVATLAACGNNNLQISAAEETLARGPHNGQLLSDGDFSLELAIYETGVPPEFRAWATSAGQLLDPNSVDLRVMLTRLGDLVDDIGFLPQGDFLRGDALVYEPHSFVVSIEATYGGKNYRWEYENLEGRTRIDQQTAAAFGIETMIAGPALIEETVSVYGHILPNEQLVREVSARFEGEIQTVNVSLGESVQKGDTLATIESNDSLRAYSITAPIAGVITEQAAHADEQTGGRRLFTIVDVSSVWADLAVFPSNRSQVNIGAAVSVSPAAGGASIESTISNINVLTETNQSVMARTTLNNEDGLLMPGTYVTATIKVAENTVPLAVKRSGLQSFRDFTVVYAQVGEEYEVRMLELGRQAGEWVEVLGGLEPGTAYVTENSYVIKADIEKSGAAHDH